MWQMDLDPINKFKEKKFNCYVTKVHLATASLRFYSLTSRQSKSLKDLRLSVNVLFFPLKLPTTSGGQLEEKNTSSDLMELAALTCPSTNYTEKEKYVLRDRIIMLFPFM